MLEFYETFYRIHDFTKPGQALNTIAMHPKEEYFKNSIYDNRLRKFLELDIATKMGMSFHEFLELPRYEIQNIIRVMTEFQEKVNRIEEKNQEQIRREQEKQQREQAKHMPSPSSFSEG